MLHYFNICLERWKTHQNPNRFGFACSAAGLFPFPFGGPFDGPLPGPLAATTGAWECIDTEDTENEYDWIWLNNMHLNETDANWIKLKLIGGTWMQMDQSFAGFQRTLKRYLLYPSIKITWIHKPPTHQHYWKVQLCATLPHSWPLHFLWPLRRPLLLPRLVLALLLLWALLWLEQPANICEPKNWHTSKITGTTTRETPRQVWAFRRPRLNQAHYKVITRSWTEQVNTSC